MIDLEDGYPFGFFSLEYKTRRFIAFSYKERSTNFDWIDEIFNFMPDSPYAILARKRDLTDVSLDEQTENFDFFYFDQLDTGSFRVIRSAPAKGSDGYDMQFASHSWPGYALKEVRFIREI